MFYHPRNQPT